MDKLKSQDQDFAKMLERHKFLDKRLDDLSGKSHLSAEEETEERMLKREKLHLRDRIEETLRNHRNIVLPA